MVFKFWNFEIHIDPVQPRDQMTDLHLSTGQGMSSCLRNGKATIGTASLANDAKETR